LRITPDGGRYLAMARGESVPMPFHLRWLLPWLCGGVAWRWVAATWLGMAALVAGTCLLGLQHGLNQGEALVAGALVAGLPSLRFAAQAPVLVDMPGLASAVWAAVLWHPYPYAAVALVVLGAAISEKAPIWASVFAWSPWLLLALSLPLSRRLLFDPGEVEPGDPLRDTLLHPVRTGIAWHRGKWANPMVMVAPWGACLAVVLFPTPPVLVALAVAYAQLLLATDSVRLYQQAAPMVAIYAAASIPAQWAVPVLLAHWFNPWAGDGI
jgi:hypothetical protein